MSQKSPAIEQFLNGMSQRLFGRTRKEGECVTCGAQVKPEDFKDDLSRKEYQISFMCQKCQDATFEATPDIRKGE